MGVPVIGCECDVCRSTDPRNQRMRPGALMTCGEKSFLIDTAPEFRLQALKYGIKRLDGVLFTHSHYDHIAGIDDLRIFSFKQQKPLPALLSRECYNDIDRAYPYLTHPETDLFTKNQKFDFQILDSDHGNVAFQGLSLRYVSYIQGKAKVNGYRFKDFAYISDIKEYEESIFDYLLDLDTLVVSALRWESTPVHFNISEALAFVEKVKPKRAYLTHIAHNLDFEETESKLPPNVRLAYDGLEIPFNAEID